MKRQNLIIYIALLSILFLLIHSQSHAGTFTAFDSKSFVRGSGKPVVETASFNIKNPNTTYTLKIYNGGLKSEYSKTSSAIVKLNGSTVFNENDFNQQVSQLQKQVPLSAGNSLSVELKSTPNSGITITIEGEDNEPPAVSVASPVDGTYLNNPSITVTGTASDSISWVNAVTVNGSSVSLNGESYNSNAPLTEGQNIITVSATDAAGNTGNSSISVILDTKPPNIIIDPVPSIINNPQLTITGKIEDTSPIRALINGNPITLANNTFTTTVNLTEGNNTITIAATDKAGNTSSTSLIITLDTVAPVTEITSPINGSTVTTGTITVTGTVDDSISAKEESGGVTVTVNGIGATVSNNTFTAINISLTEGTNTITIIAEDMAENKYETNISLVYSADKVPPVINVALPLGYWGTTTSQTMKVTGSIDDNTATVVVNNVPASVSNNNFSAEITLDEGVNNISITATDPYGNTSRIYKTAYLDLKAPVVTINPPVNGGYINNATYQYKINADLSDLSFKYYTVYSQGKFNMGTYYAYNQQPLLVNGQELPSSQYYITGCTPKNFGPSWQGEMCIEFSIRYAWQPGPNIITLNVLDISGRATSTSITAYFDPYEPSITDISPANGSIVFSDKIDVTGTVADNYTIAAVKVNGRDAVISDNTFKATLPLAEGLNSINTTATDAAGNTVTNSRKVTYIKPDTIPPSIAITSPTEGQPFNLSLIDVTGTIDDVYATVTVNGVKASLNGKTFQAFDVPLNIVGNNAIEATALDLFGNIATASVTVFFDNIPPLINIISHENGSTINTNTITVSGYTNDETVTITVNGATAIIENNIYSAVVSLTEGINIIIATALDRAGNRGNAMVTVHLDTSAPTVTSTIPEFNATDVPLNTAVTVIFSESVDAETIKHGAFKLTGETGEVSSTITHNGDTATFTPYNLLAPGKVYAVTIKGGNSGVKDNAGNHSASDYSWLFKTEYKPLVIEVTGTSIDSLTVLIKGTVKTQTQDIGITVNGVIAEINGQNWAAIVPLQTGTNTIEATVVDGSGNTDKQTINIYTQSIDQPVKINTNPTSGIVPLNATFTIDTGITNPIVSYKIDFEGDGVTDFETTTTSGIMHIYETPGIYYPTVTVTDSQYNTYTETTAINVLDKAPMDTLLRAKWEGMKAALGSGDTAIAATYILDSRSSKYKEVFDVLKDQLLAIFSQAEDFVLVSVFDNRAEYENIVVEDGNAYSYPVIFVKDENGLWKINQF